MTPGKPKRGTPRGVLLIFIAYLAILAEVTVAKEGTPVTRTQRVHEGQPRGHGMTLGESLGTFGFDLLSTLVRHHPDSNVFVSPLSVGMALAMVSNGARDPWRSQILKTLALNSTGSPVSEEIMHSANSEFQSLLEKLLNVKSGQSVATAPVIEIANSMWVERPANPDFSQVLQEAYGSQVFATHFGNGQAFNSINQWVKKKTHSVIPSILSKPVSPDTQSVLINAIYFKGSWRFPFRRSLTRNANFESGDGTIIQVPMMFLRRSFHYKVTENFEAVLLPYQNGSGTWCQMMVLLPKAGTAPIEILAYMGAWEDEKAWATLTNGFGPRVGKLWLPRTKISFESSLIGALNDIGLLTQALRFDDVLASHRAMGLNDVLHKTFLTIDEDGTMAAGVTSTSMRAQAINMDRRPPFEMKVNRPFVVFIFDVMSKVPLFAGVVREPVPMNENSN